MDEFFVVFGFNLFKVFLIGKVGGDDLFLVIVFVLVCLVFGVVWLGGYYNLGFNGERWLKLVCGFLVVLF